MPAKSRSVRLLITPAELKAWRHAAITYAEGNLSLFIRGAVDHVILTKHIEAQQAAKQKASAK